MTLESFYMISGVRVSPVGPSKNRRSPLIVTLRDLYELLRARKAVDVILLGHSFGGVVVLEYVLTHPDDVQGVILENGMADARISMDDRVKGAFNLCQRVSLPEVENVVRKYQEGHALSFSEFFDKLMASDELREELYWYERGCGRAWVSRRLV